MAKISVIIPTGKGKRSSLTGICSDLESQTVPPDEILVIEGVSPSGKARNQGAEQATGDLLVFIDDDVRLGCESILGGFQQVLQSEPSVGLVGTSQLLPPDSTRFQRALADQLERTRSAVVPALTDSDFATTACCALSRKTFDEVGRFHGQIPRGVDPEFRRRVRGTGKRIVMLPHCWHYHPMPNSLAALARMGYRDGFSSRYVQLHFPDALVETPSEHAMAPRALASTRSRLERRTVELIRTLGQGRWLRLVYDLAYLAGFAAASMGTSRPQ